MQKKPWISVFQIAVTYIGTVVGAGFASGQEIWQFFSKNGVHAIFGIGFTSVLFFIFGAYALRLGPKYQVNSYTALVSHLFGKKIGNFTNALLLITIFGLNVAMVAGGGALIEQVAGLPLYIGAMLWVLATILMLYYGIKGIIAANSVIVPIMFAWILLSSYVHITTLHFFHWYLPNNINTIHHYIFRFLLIFSYLGFNVGLSLPVLVPLGAMHPRRLDRWLGSFFGAIGLGILMMLIHLLMVNHQPSVLGAAIPMAEIAKVLPIPLQAGLILALGAEIYSTLLANAFGLASELSSLTKKPFFTWVIISLVLAYLLAQIGFSFIVSWFYPIFGLFGMVLLLLIMVQESMRLNV